MGGGGGGGGVKVEVVVQRVDLKLVGGKEEKRIMHVIELEHRWCP